MTQTFIQDCMGDVIPYLTFDSFTHSFYRGSPPGTRLGFSDKGDFFLANQEKSLPFIRTNDITFLTSLVGLEVAGTDSPPYCSSYFRGVSSDKVVPMLPERLKYLYDNEWWSWLLTARPLTQAGLEVLYSTLLAIQPQGSSIGSWFTPSPTRDRPTESLCYVTDAVQLRFLFGLRLRAENVREPYPLPKWTGYLDNITACQRYQTPITLSYTLNLPATLFLTSANIEEARNHIVLAASQQAMKDRLGTPWAGIDVVDRKVMLSHSFALAGRDEWTEIDPRLDVTDSTFLSVYELGMQLTDGL